MNVEAYLNRINYHGSRSPDADTLRELQIAHLLSVPFENLSIHAGEPIVLEDEALFSKIVDRRRGGFCYEANGLFSALLRNVGFEVVMLAAGVAHPNGGFSSDFDHMTLMVTPAVGPLQRWLVDVGFGDSFVEPLLIDEREDQRQEHQTYRIAPDHEYLVLFLKEGDAWKPQYRFTLQPHVYADYEEMCKYHQTSPESHFTQRRICSRATEDGRITLSEMRFITTTGGGPSQHKEERTLGTPQEYDQILLENFGIVMT